MPDDQPLMQGVETLSRHVQDSPLLLWLALAILPGLPFPSSPLLVLAGVVWREHPALGCGICLIATAVNMSWTYALAAGPAQVVASRWISRWQHRLPQLPTVSSTQALLVLRLTPGVPFFLQNYLLGYLRVPYGRYLIGSLACNAPMACGFVLTGAGVASGAWKPMLSGIGLIVTTAIAVKIIRQLLRKRRTPSQANATE